MFGGEGTGEFGAGVIVVWVARVVVVGDRDPCWVLGRVGLGSSSGLGSVGQDDVHHEG